MTFDDDFVQLDVVGGPIRASCQSLGLDWPPPEVIMLPLSGTRRGIFRRVSLSAVSDDQRSQMTHVCRGAQYVPDGVIDQVH